MTARLVTIPIDNSSRVVRRALHIAVMAPPWIPVPPPAYGGTEAVVASLCDELAARGHDVTLFAAPWSRSVARVRTPLERAHPDEIGSALFEADYIASVYDAIETAAMNAKPFDLVHDHSGFTALAMAHRVGAPVVHTLHGVFDEQTRPFYERHGHKARLVAISHSQADQAPPGVPVTDVVPNPLRCEDWPFCKDKGDYLLWMGRMDPVKGAHRAITAARRAGSRLVLAGPVQPGQQEYFAREIEPQLDGQQTFYAGEVGGRRRKELFAGARGFLMPIRWAEPFGMVMVEALACGTPVLAFPEGAAGEIVIHGENGFHVADEYEMADAIDALRAIDPHRCRESIAERYDVGIVADGYEAVYNHALNEAEARARLFERQRRLPSGRLHAGRDQSGQAGALHLEVVS
jgi:glycosyltransferase involved in cell wall biosynthesis